MGALGTHCASERPNFGSAKTNERSDTTPKDAATTTDDSDVQTDEGDTRTTHDTDTDSQPTNDTYDPGSNSELEDDSDTGGTSGSSFATSSNTSTTNAEQSSEGSETSNFTSESNSSSDEETVPCEDCDCQVDDESTCALQYASVGVCALRTLACEAGFWPSSSACAPTSPELCDPGFNDDDCNGFVDENCDCINGETNACGIAGGGVVTCVDGEFGPCTCPAENTVDIDDNDTPDTDESLLPNGRFTSDLSEWVQSEEDNQDFDGILFEHTIQDGTGVSCSGSMLLTSTENAGDNYAEQCLDLGAGDYVAAAQAVLVRNGNSLNTTSYDPSYVELSVSAFDNGPCQGTPLSEDITSIELIPGDSWVTLTSAVTAPADTLSVRVRITVVADEDDGLDWYATRAVSWDNVNLHIDN